MDTHETLAKYGSQYPIECFKNGNYLYIWEREIRLFHVKGNIHQPRPEVGVNPWDHRRLVLINT